MHKWQEQLLNGMRKGELCIWTGGRQAGKSQLTQYMANWQELMREKYPYRKLNQVPVDGVMWYTVQCNSEAANWLRDRQGTDCYEHIDQSWHSERNTFDVSEALYLQLGLKY